MRSTSILLAILVLFLTAAAARRAHSQPTAIVGATLIDGTGAPPLENAIILFDGERITAVGPAATTRIPDNARIVNAHGKWILPGLIDMHVHLDEVITPDMFTRFGVTSVRDVGSRLVTIQQWRAKGAKGQNVPHIYWMGRNIDEGKPSWWGAVAISKPADAGALLTDMDRQGVDGVKLYVNAGSQVTRAVIDEAHLRGWPVTAHLNKTMPSQAAGFGIDNLEHVAQLFIEINHHRSSAETFGSGYSGVSSVDLNGRDAVHLISILAKHRVAVTPTLTVSLMPAIGQEAAGRYLAGWADFSDAWVKEWHRSYWSFITPQHWTKADSRQASEAYAKYSEMTGLLYRSGVPLVAGTDTPAPWVLPGAGLLVELELMTRAGVPPAEAIYAATGRAANVLRREDEVGTVQPGRRADLLLISANPIKDIRALHRISAVYLAGKKIR